MTTSTDGVTTASPDNASNLSIRAVMGMPTASPLRPSVKQTATVSYDLPLHQQNSGLVMTFSGNPRFNYKIPVHHGLPWVVDLMKVQNPCSGVYHTYTKLFQCCTDESRKQQTDITRSKLCIYGFGICAEMSKMMVCFRINVSEGSKSMALKLFKYSYFSSFSLHRIHVKVTNYWESLRNSSASFGHWNVV